jgi:hypothetical protein
MKATWPTKARNEPGLLEQRDYLETVIRDARLVLLNETRPKKKKNKPGATDMALDPPTHVTFYLSGKFPDWQQAAVQVLRTLYDSVMASFKFQNLILNQFHKISYLNLIYCS